MLAVVRRCAQASRLQVRAFSAGTVPSTASADPDHKKWLEAVSKYPIVIPRYDWTLEWALPTPVPTHQFEQAPLTIEVTDRHPDSDALVYKGPNVVGGYPHPETGKIVSREEHLQLIEKYNMPRLALAEKHHH